MATRLFSALGKLGVGIAIAGSVVNTALYNGKIILLHLPSIIICWLSHCWFPVVNPVNSFWCKGHASDAKAICE